MSIATARSTNTMPMKIDIIASAWPSVMPDRTSSAITIVRRLNQTTPMVRPPTAKAAIVLRRGASVRISSVTGDPSSRARDDRDDADHSDPVGAKEDPLVDDLAFRHAREPDLADHALSHDAGPAVWDAVEQDSIGPFFLHDG